GVTLCSPSDVMMEAEVGMIQERAVSQEVWAAIEFLKDKEINSPVGPPEGKAALLMISQIRYRVIKTKLQQ
ncbi:hypothetical protein PSZ20_22855, partial [Shigella flexneri]|nr:hypothetical protein [Shigella flexneri]